MEWLVFLHVWKCLRSPFLGLYLSLKFWIQHHLALRSPEAWTKEKKILCAWWKAKLFDKHDRLKLDSTHNRSQTPSILPRREKLHYKEFKIFSIRHSYRVIGICPQSAGNHLHLHHNARCRGFGFPCRHKRKPGGMHGRADCPNLAWTWRPTLVHRT